MTNKHQVYLFTNESSIHENGQMVTVYWKVDFNRELDPYFNKRKYKHDFDLLKEGVGQLNINITPRREPLSKEHLLAYAEVLAAKHVVSTKGINAFGFTDYKMTIRRDQLHINVSQPLSVDLIDRKRKDISILSTKFVGPATGNSAGYLYGVTVSLNSEMKYLSNQDSFDFYNKVTDIQIREADNARTNLADIVIDYRSIEEWMNMEWVRYGINEKGQQYPRAYDTVYELVKGSEIVIYENSKYVEKTQRVFGEDALVINHVDNRISFQLSPLGHHYLLVGMQKYLSPLLVSEMKKSGYAQDIKLVATEEELAELQEKRDLNKLA